MPTADAAHRPAPEGRRRQIVEVALRLFGELGVQNVSTRRIAESVGITQPSLYAHFKSHSEILSAACALAFERLSSRLEAALAEPPGPDRLRRSMRTYIAFGLEQPDAYRVAFMLEAPSGAAEMQPLPGFEAGYRTYLLHRTIIAAELAPDTPEAELELVAQSLWASIHGLVSLLIARPAFPWTDIDALIDRHVEMVARPLVGPATYSGPPP